MAVMLSPLTQFLALGITGYTGRYHAESNEWIVTVIRHADGVTMVAVGAGPDPDAASQAAIVDFRQQIAKAMGGVVKGAA